MNMPTTTETYAADKLFFDRISANGINVDREGLEAEVAQLKKDEQNALMHLNQLADYHTLIRSQHRAFGSKDTHFNPRSKKHINAYLAEMGHDPLESVAEAVLEPALPPEMFDAIMLARRTRKYWGDLVTLQNAIWEMTGKIHVQWTNATTGRWYTGKPPIQTMSKICRKFLVPDEGNSFWVIDWRQQELRILAHLSGDENLLEIFESGEDPHLGAYQRVTGNPPNYEDSSILRNQRDLGKMLNYALIYGLDAPGLGARLRIPNHQAGALISQYYEAFPALAAWRRKQFEAVASSGFVETLMGRIIPVQQGTGSLLERQAVNYKVQGSAADQLLKFLRELSEHPDSSMFDSIRATIHDAVLVETTSVNESRTVGTICNLMSQDFMGIKAVVDVKGPSPNWLEAMSSVDDSTDEGEDES